MELQTIYESWDCDVQTTPLLTKYVKTALTAMCSDLEIFARIRYFNEIYYYEILVSNDLEVFYQRCSYKNMFPKYVANLQENIHEDV